jgi:autotransporter-associated beta strand protein
LFSNGANNFISTSGFTLTTDVGSGGQISYLGTVGLGAGGIIKDGSGSMYLSRDNSYSGNTVINDGIVVANNLSSLGTSASGTQVNDGASLSFELASLSNGSTIDEPLTLNGEGNGSVETLRINKSSGSASEIDITGAIILSSSDVNIGSNISLLISGVISGSGAFTYTDFQDADNAYLKLTADNTYSGSTVVNRTFIVNGSQPNSNVTVPDGKTLKGKGTVGVLTVQSGGTLAPGESAGCLNAGNTTINGSFDVEIAGRTGCTQYDRLNVTGTVDLTGAMLNVSFLNDFVPKAGDEFVILNNDGVDAITGTFEGLAQGDTFKVDGVTFMIAYDEGGGENDVVLTVVDVDEEAPGTPNTGTGNIKANPILTGIATLISSGSIALIVRRLRIFS